MINFYFGLPGQGKTTHLVATALKENDRINKGRSKFSRVLTNVRLTVPEGVNSNIFLFDNDDIGKFDMSSSLILIDEAWQLFDCRDFSRMSPEKKDFLNYHRHRRQVLYLYNQLHDGLDKKVRNITNNVYYLCRNFLTGRTRAKKVCYTMYIPRKPKSAEVLSRNDGSDISMIYYKAGFFTDLLSRLFVERPIRLKKFYKYFDSYECESLPYKDFEKL